MTDESNDNDVSSTELPPTPATTNRPDFVMPKIATDLDQKSLRPETLEIRHVDGPEETS